MNYFSSDKFLGSKTREERRCKCGAQPTLAHRLMDPTRGITVRLFECGPRTKSKAASVGGLERSAQKSRCYSMPREWHHAMALRLSSLLTN